MTDDDALMRRFAAGDARAFDQLYERHQGPLYRYLRRLLGRTCPQQLDEVFQDSWMKMIQARASWSPQGASFRTWLFTLAHHRAVDCLRRSGREVDWGEDEDGEPVFERLAAAAQTRPDDDAADRQFWRDAGRRLLDCLEALPVAQRAAFLLHHEDGLSVAELAQALDLGFETAKSRLRYALAKLRGCMGAFLDPLGGADPA